MSPGVRKHPLFNRLDKQRRNRNRLFLPLEIKLAYEINPRKVAGVVIEANQAISNKGFNHGETLVGLSELIGRVIVEVAATPIQSNEMIKAAIDHINKTVQVGSQATQKSLIERV